MNKASSRSHAIFTLVVETHELQGDNHITRCGKINFVDLAGSERIYKVLASFLSFCNILILCAGVGGEFERCNPRGSRHQPFTALFRASNYLSARRPPPTEHAPDTECGAGTETTMSYSVPQLHPHVYSQRQFGGKLSQLLSVYREHGYQAI